ncbi:InaA protein [Bordetella sputigena]|uniref:lipopolysaccharide kinase InaA family protein n=1 Tax=Bordetella sputigena TaxID=1416810 RepID=UPI0039EEA985
MRSKESSFWWSVQGEWVEEPNNRRGGFSGVQRVVLPESGDCYYVKRQRNHLFRSARYPMGRPTLLREWRSMRFCQKIGVPTAPVVFFEMRRDEQGWDAILVTRDLRGYVSLDRAFTEDLWSAEQRAAALRAVAATLISLHRARRKHGHLYPKEVFVNLAGARPTVAIVDWELSRYCLTASRAARPDVRRMLKSLAGSGMTQDELRLFIDEYRASGIKLPPLPQLIGSSGVPAGATGPDQPPTSLRG